jgi:hypothetical protein
MPDLTVYFRDADHITGEADDPITGGRLVKVSDGMTAGGHTLVTTAGAGQVAVGVAGHDAAAGDLIHVVRKGVVGLVAAEAISAGDRVVAAADGKIAVADPAVVAASGDAENLTIPFVNVIGVALDDIDNAATGPVALSL